MAWKSFFKCFFLLLIFISTMVSAMTGRYYLGGSLDNNIAIIGNANPTINYFSGTTITDHYYPTERRHAALLLNLQGGYEFTGARFIPSTAIGLGVYRTLEDYNVSGQVVETATGNSNTLYNYQYNLKQWIAMAEAKLTWHYHHFTPYLNVGIGTAWNELANYHEAPIFDDGFMALAPFAAYTNVNFAYEAGIGLGYEFNFNGNLTDMQHERIAIGYQYMNFGNIRFSTRNADYPYALTPGRLSSNNFYVSFIHLF